MQAEIPRSASHRRPRTNSLASVNWATVADAALAVVALAYSIAVPLALLPMWVADNPDYRESVPSGLYLVAITTLEALSAVGLLVRRRLPMITAGAAAGALLLGGTGLTFPVGLYTLVVQGRLRWALATGVPAALIPFVVYLPWFTDETAPKDATPLLLWLTEGLMAYWLPVICAPVVIAVGVQSLRNRAERLQREQVLAARNARLEERARIARDMHDVVAHYVGLMVLQAGALEVRSKSEPETRQCAQLLGNLGRRAMAELHELLSVLRPDDAGTYGSADHRTTDGGGGGGGAWRRDLHALVNEARLAGVPVTWQIEGEPEEAGSAARQIAYRVIQEGLANAARHASGAEVHVTVRCSPRGLEIGVRNGPAPAQVVAVPATPGGGHGLTGMRERVSLAGGTLRVHPTEDGGFSVAADIPAEVSEPGSGVLTLADPRES